MTINIAINIITLNFITMIGVILIKFVSKFFSRLAHSASSFTMVSNIGLFFVIFIALNSVAGKRKVIYESSPAFNKRFLYKIPSEDVVISPFPSSRRKKCVSLLILFLGE